jgi:hypothetical protein
MSTGRTFVSQREFFQKTSDANDRRKAGDEIATCEDFGPGTEWPHRWLSSVCWTHLRRKPSRSQFHPAPLARAPLRSRLSPNHVFDNKVEQTIIRFASYDETIAVGFVFDLSGSIGNMLRQSQLAAHQFFMVAEPEDQPLSGRV